MTDPFNDFFNNVTGVSGKLSPNRVIDDRAELECINLYNDGWKQDGLDRVHNSNDIIVYWKKECEERKHVYLTFAQQARWIKLIEQKIKSGEIKI